MTEFKEAADSIDSEELLKFANALRDGDFSVRLNAEGDSPAADAARQLNYFAQSMDSMLSQLKRLSTEMKQGVFGGQSEMVLYVHAGPWRECLEAFNAMEATLTGQIRNFARISTRMAAGKLDQAVTVDCEGETLQIKTALNALRDQLQAQKQA